MREKFGRFVLLHEVDSTGLGAEYRAAKLGPSGLERLVSLVRLSPAVSKQPEIAKDLLEHIKQAAQLQSPYVLKVHGIGKIESQYYLAYEFLEAKSLKAILAQCRQEGFPFSVNHTLLIASKVCAALEYAHGRKTEEGRKFAHGWMSPEAVMLSSDGEVRVRFFGVWPSRLREAGILRDDERAYQAPEQRAGALGDTQSDIYALGAVVFECLTGERFQQLGREEDLATRLGNARLQDPSVEPRTIPKPISDILRRSLAATATGRFVGVEEMRKAIDTLLFSGDFTPTTFNLAFLMHSLFREQLDKESKQIKQEREASYNEFLVEEAPPTIVAPPLPPRPEAVPEARPEARTEMRTEPRPERERPPIPQISRPQATPSRVDIYRTPSPSETAPHTLESLQPRTGPGFEVPSATRRNRMALMAAGALGLLLLLGGASIWLLRRGGARPPSPPPITPEMQAAMERVQGLEAQLKALQDEKAAAEAKAAQEAKAKLEAQARARGQAVDPAALQRVQEDAARRARDEQDRRNQGVLQQLEQQRQAEQARIEQRQAEAAAGATPVTLPTATPPTPAPTPAVASVTTPEPVAVEPTPTAAPAEAAPVATPTAGGGALIPPILQSAPRVSYPPVALRQRVEGVVEIRAFVNEQGVVTETQLQRGIAGRVGLNEAAIENVRQRRYKPATRDGEPTGAWVTVRVEFRLPR